MKRLILLLFITCTLFTSCDKSEDSLKNGGTFKLTASSGTTKSFTLSSERLPGVSGFGVKVFDEGTEIENIEFFIHGFCDAGMSSIVCALPAPIITGKEYLHGIRLEDWIDEDAYKIVKSVIKFSNFKYPGRITGIATGYDINGKVIMKGEFDLNSIKPEI